MTADTTLRLEGVVSSGLGEGAHFTAIEWVAEEFRVKLGFAAFPGTLNLRMDGPQWQMARRRLLREPGIAITPATGFCAAKCFALDIEGRLAGAVVIPDMPEYPADKFEIVAPVSVRALLGLSDGDRLRLRLAIDGRIGRLQAPAVWSAA